MAKILMKVTDRFRQLQSRERKLIILSIPLLALTTIFAILAPLIDQRASLSDELVALNTDMVWLVEQREVVQRLNSGCASRDIMDGSSREKLNKLSRRNQIRLESVTNSSGLIKVSFSGSDANRSLQMAHQIACSGFKIESFSLARRSSSELKGSMEVAVSES